MELKRKSRPENLEASIYRGPASKVHSGFGHNNPVDMQWAKKLGANHYVVKPYTSDAILTQLTAL